MVLRFPGGRSCRPGPGAAPKPSGEPAGSVTSFPFKPWQTSLERVGVLLGVAELQSQGSSPFPPSAAAA